MKRYARVFALALVTGLFTSQNAAAQENKILPTKLQITVLSEIGNPVEGAEVMIYASEEDYVARENPIQGIKKSDSKGRVKYTGLETKAYYIFAQKGKTDNDDGTQFSLILKSGVNNKVNVVLTSGD